jgi:hypothetical protein
VGRLKLKRRAGKQVVAGKAFRLADEVAYIQRRAAQKDSRIVTIGRLLLFSTETGDAWLLEPEGQLATPIAQQGDQLPVYIEDTDTNFSVGWTGRYQIDAEMFVYSDSKTGRIRSILGYPTGKIAQQIAKVSC